MKKTLLLTYNYTAINTPNNNNFFLKLNYIIFTYKKVLISITFLLFLNFAFTQNNFLNNQKKFQRVSEAFSLKESDLKNDFKNANLNYPPSDILLISYKAEGELQLWVKQYNNYRFFKSYDVCKKSGDFGPKREQGDHQVPEGLYNINIFNPTSNFHLSLGINYPNKSDRILSSSNNLGGDIYIHGDCVTIGCLPMTDDIIKEIYVLMSVTKNNNISNLPIYLFPFKFSKLTEYIFYKEYPEHVDLWNNLKEEYIYFKNNLRIRKYNIDSSGKYVFF